MANPGLIRKSVASDLGSEIENLRALYAYEPESGSITSRVRFHNWPSGRIMGTKMKNGYILCSVFSRRILAHDLAWLLYTGKVPSMLDHINGVRSDNRWVNLRQVTESQNCMNSGLNRRNKSGVKGVAFYKAYQKWTAELVALNKKYFLGYFENKEDAIAARKDAEGKYHGDYARKDNTTFAN